MFETTLEIVNLQMPCSIYTILNRLLLSQKKRILLLKPENKLLKDNKQRFIEILFSFNESNIQSRHNKNTLSSLIQKNTSTGSNNTLLEKKDKRELKTYPV